MQSNWKMIFKMFKAALFDLDGVILDTESQYSIFWSGIFQRYFGDGEVFAKKIKGQTLQQIYKAYFDRDIERQQLISSELETFEQQMAYPFIPGFVTFVTALRSLNVKTAIVTSSTNEKMSHVYQAHPELSAYFDTILTAGDFPRSKPAPDCYLLAAERLCVPISECVVFEDSFNGLRSGRDSGAKVVGLSTTNPQEAIAPLADIVLPNFIFVASPLSLAETLCY